MSRIRRFRPAYDPHITCCCSIEEHLSGEYVLFEDYMKLLREYSEYRGKYTKPDNAICASRGCNNPAVVMHGGRPNCMDCMPPYMKPDWEFPTKFDPSD